MFSKKMEYGYIILKKLKNTTDNKVLSGKEILENTQIPYNMGLSILTELSSAGLLISTKGKNGGFILHKETVYLLDLFIALEANKKNISVSQLDRVQSNKEYHKKLQKIGAVILNELAKTQI